MSGAATPQSAKHCDSLDSAKAQDAFAKITACQQDCGRSIGKAVSATAQMDDSKFSTDVYLYRCSISLREARRQMEKAKVTANRAVVGQDDPRAVRRDEQRWRKELPAASAEFERIFPPEHTGGPIKWMSTSTSPHKHINEQRRMTELARAAKSTDKQCLQGVLHGKGLPTIYTERPREEMYSRVDRYLVNLHESNVARAKRENVCLDSILLKNMMLESQHVRSDDPERRALDSAPGPYAVRPLNDASLRDELDEIIETGSPRLVDKLFATTEVVENMQRTADLRELDRMKKAMARSTVGWASSPLSGSSIGVAKLGNSSLGRACDGSPLASAGSVNACFSPVEGSPTSEKAHAHSPPESPVSRLAMMLPESRLALTLDDLRVVSPREQSETVLPTLNYLLDESAGKGGRPLSSRSADDVPRMDPVIAEKLHRLTDSPIPLRPPLLSLSPNTRQEVSPSIFTGSPILRPRERVPQSHSELCITTRDKKQLRFALDSVLAQSVSKVLGFVNLDNASHKYSHNRHAHSPAAESLDGGGLGEQSAQADASALSMLDGASHRDVVKRLVHDRAVQDGLLKIKAFFTYAALATTLEKDARSLAKMKASKPKAFLRETASRIDRQHALCRYVSRFEDILETRPRRSLNDF